MPKVNFPKKETLPKKLHYTAETCGACLLDLTDSLTVHPSKTSEANVGDSEPIAALPCCSHLFHSTCIFAWSLQENSCPLCKQRFRCLGKYLAHTGTLVEKINIPQKDFEEAQDYYDHEIDICEECKAPVGEDHETIVCDGMERTCNRLFHLTCVGLPRLPRGDWLCGDCEGSQNRAPLTQERSNRGSRGKQEAPAHVHRTVQIRQEPPSAKDNVESSRIEISAHAAPATTRKRATPSFELPNYDNRNKRLHVSGVPDSARATKSSPLPRMFAAAAAAERVIETLQEIAPNVEKRKSALEEIREKRLARIAVTSTVQPTDMKRDAKPHKTGASYEQDFLFGI